MNWTISHLCAGQLLGLTPRLSIDELYQIQRFLIEKEPLSPFLEQTLLQVLESSSLYSVIDERLNRWTSTYCVLTPFSLEYPKNFLSLETPPPLLFVEGSIPWNQSYNLAVVGRREARPHTLKWMSEEFHQFLSYENSALNIVSGGARGIDQKAHSSALLYQKPTTVFLPSGLANIYPQSLLPMKEAILANQGALVSHFPPETVMHKKNFHSRNQLIATLADACLILEAEQRSGTYKTALYCQEQNTPLAVVPSFPLDPSYSGSLQLLYDGASMIRDAKDLSLFKSLNFKSTIAID